MIVLDSIQSSYAARSSLSLLHPYDVVGARKVRIGRSFDGGYVMIDAFDRVQAAYSFGINDDVSWDTEIAQRGIDIFQYDHTIEGLPTNHARFHWEKVGIAPHSEGEMRSIPDIIQSHGHEDLDNILLKCDIESAEWEVLACLPNAILRKFSQIVIEIHDIHRFGNPDDFTIREALGNLTNYHNVVHVHGNNYGGMAIIGGYAVPNVMELTLLRKDMGQFTPSNLTFPTALDMPCNGNIADLFLGSFKFS